MTWISCHILSICFPVTSGTTVAASCEQRRGMQGGDDEGDSPGVGTLPCPCFACIPDVCNCCNLFGKYFGSGLQAAFSRHVPCSLRVCQVFSAALSWHSGRYSQ